MSPLEHYRQCCSRQQCQPDAEQLAVITALDAIYQQIISSTIEASRWHAFFSRKVIRKPQTQIKGLYLWGGVGRGKTWLMDMFYHALPGERKLRIHFHRFMLRVHDELRDLEGQRDPLAVIAKKIKSEADVLCFDEFFVTDIADAMLLGTLLEILFSEGVTLIATSNIKPENLYHNGLQRTRFLTAIALLTTHCHIMQLNGETDYRQRSTSIVSGWVVVGAGLREQQLATDYLALSGNIPLCEEILEINHRSLLVMGRSEGVVAISFNHLCGEGRSQNDYIRLSAQYHHVLLFDVPVLTASDEEAARRFLALVDEFYERRVKLVVYASAEMRSLYQGEKLRFEYQRCLSRLTEMQSAEYQNTPHQP
ncbi:MAG: Cell division protein ZapE [Candidatus Erwinia impunctatus]|nr:Cell division protein ZapE [Culicoides impunctatus]